MLLKERAPLNNPPDIEDGGPTRTCIATGAVGDRAGFVRFARDPDGVVVPDFAGKLPGRGAWVAASRTAIVTAAAKGLFAKAFKAPSRIAAGLDPEAFAAGVESGIEARALAALGLARRVGTVATGYEQVREALAAGGIAVLLTARDAADGGAAKLYRDAGAARIIKAFSADRQSAALGRERCVHATLKKGPHAERFLREIDRLAGFREVGVAPAEARSAI